MTRQNSSKSLWVLRRSDQAVVAVILVVCLVAAVVWWSIANARRGPFVELDRAGTHRYAFKVDVNRAAWPELAQLPGVGEITARKIIASRESDGPFKEVDALERIRGIGPKTVERIRPYLLPIENRPQ